MLQGLKDESMYLQSAKEIYDQVQTNHKELKWYEASGHIITVGPEREAVFNDVEQFISSV